MLCEGSVFPLQRCHQVSSLSALPVLQPQCLFTDISTLVSTITMKRPCQFDGSQAKKPRRCAEQVRHGKEWRWFENWSASFGDWKSASHQPSCPQLPHHTCMVSRKMLLILWFEKMYNYILETDSDLSSGSTLQSVHPSPQSTPQRSRSNSLDMNTIFEAATPRVSFGGSSDIVYIERIYYPRN